MFVTGQPKFTFFSLILDNCYSRLSKNNDRCRFLIKIAMSNIEDSLGYASIDIRETAQETTSDELSCHNLNNINFFRRAWSAENISDFRSLNNSWTGGPPGFYSNWNWPPTYPIQQGGYSWNNASNYPVPSQFHPDYHCILSGGSINTFQNNFWPPLPPPLPPPPPPPLTPPAYNLHSSHSVNTMQRRYCYRRNNSEDNLLRRVQVNPKILKVLSKRYWEDVRKKKRTSSKPGFEFTLMSYNVLAQDLITEHPYLYKNHNPRALEWRKRWSNLFDEISSMLPDIMCLQEVQESHLSGFYDTLESLGYKGIYKKRTGIRCDGCAIYYKVDKFNLIEFETVEFFQPNVDILNRDNIAIIAKFAPSNNPDSQLIVANTHLLYNPRRQDVRLAQTQLLLTEIERLSFLCKNGEDSCYCPIIITGDFNSTPESAVYQLITKAFLRYDNLSARRLDKLKNECQGNVLLPKHLEITDNCQHARLLHKRQVMQNISRIEETALIKLHHSCKSTAKECSEDIKNVALFNSGTLSHLFAFKSVYNHGDPHNVEGTTFQDMWLTVDYIFYSGKRKNDDIKDDKLKLISRYRLPRKSELGTMKIPNSALGSDHLSLVAKFKLKI